MRIREYRISLGLSVLAHAALAVVLVWGALFFSPIKFGGGGTGRASVDVWLADSEGGRRADMATSTISTKSKPSAAPSTTKHASSGEGSGEGTAGDGSGTGSGGNGEGSAILANIWKRINSHKYYPQLARERGVQGTPRIQFAIAEDGSVVDAKLAASCGEAILDDAAIETIRRAAPLPFYPGRITVGVKYSLSN